MSKTNPSKVRLPDDAVLAAGASDVETAAAGDPAAAFLALVGPGMTTVDIPASVHADLHAWQVERALASHGLRCVSADDLGDMVRLVLAPHTAD